MQYNQPWHNQSSDQTLAALETTLDGLSDDEVVIRRQSYGINKLPSPPKKSLILRFLLQFHNLFIYVLIGSACITALLGLVVDTFVIVAVVIINAIIGFYQEGKAEMAMQTIRHMLALHASTVRDGARQQINAEEIVPGDIVYLESGDKVPADLRLLQSFGLHIQESMLTGESVAVEKNTEPVAINSALGDRSCLSFSGTNVTSGQGVGVVVATGANTEIGRIGGMLSDVQTLETPLLAKMTVFTRWLTFIILGISMFMLLFGYFILNYDFADLFIAIVGIAVAAIPEGLPVVLTITLAVGVKSMAKHNAIIRRLPAIETLGAVSVICTDKTGTLTCNEMMVDSIVTFSEHLTVKGTGYNPSGTIENNYQPVTVNDHTILTELSTAAALCNDAELIQENNSWIGHGDPMEIALLVLTNKIGQSFSTTREQWTRTDIIPFDSQYKYMATLNHSHDGHASIFVKGAPEQILSICDQQRTINNTEPLNVDYWEKQANEIASRGRRVLAFAMKSVASKNTTLEHHEIQGSLIFIGLVGLIDPPRHEAKDSILRCHQAGIDIKMITGDHALTASAIGKQLGLQNSDAVLTGNDIDELNDDQLKDVVSNTGIFARTSPEHKLRLVMALQANGMTVAMTGDGVNDAPALKRADVGVAMGKTGSEAAKEASEIVLVDDNFSTIVAAVRQGRTVYDNIKKAISWAVPTSTGEAMTIILALLLGLSLPITPIQILWINMITAVTLGIVLAFEPTEENTMYRPPRPPNEGLLSVALWWHVVFVACLFLLGIFTMYEYAIMQGYSEFLARTIAMNTLAVLEIFHLFFIRNMYGTSLTLKAIIGTRIVWLAVIIVTIGQFTITYHPLLQQVFETEPIKFIDGALIILVGVIMFSIIEIEKQIRLKVSSRHSKN